MKRSVKVLLHEVFIINVKFLLKLMKRYYVISLLGVVLTALLFINFNRSQHKIFAQSISFKIDTSSAESSGPSVSQILGESSSKITDSDILSIRTSPDFLQSLAENILEADYFQKLNFNSIHQKKLRTQAEIFKGCGDINCRKSLLRGILLALFSIDEDFNISDRFILTVRTLDMFTTEKLLALIQKKIVHYRTETIRRSLTDQRQISEKIIADKTKALREENVYEKVQRLDDLKESLKRTLRKIDVLTNTLSQYEFELINSKSNIAQSKKVSELMAKNKDKNDYSKYQVLKKKRDDLASDISALENASTIFSNQDEAILNKLKEKLKSVNSDLAKVRNVSGVGGQEKFIESTQGSKSQNKFTYKVIAAKIEEVKKQIRVETIRKNAYENETKELNESMKGNTGAFEYLKLLQQKLVQLKLLESTVIPDIIFDKFVLGTRIYKEKSRMLMLIYSFVLSLFSVVIAIVIAFMFDKRILDEEEFQAYYKEINILGHAPVSK